MPDAGDRDDQVLFTMNQQHGPPGHASSSVPGLGRHQGPPAAFPATAPFALSLLGWRRIGWHLHDLHDLVKDQPELRVTIGTDYLIKPDVTIALLPVLDEHDAPFLHGVVWCKWSIRSDRVQNIREPLLDWPVMESSVVTV